MRVGGIGFQFIKPGDGRDSLDGDPYTMRMIDVREQLGVRLELLEASSNWPPDGKAP